MPNPLHTSPEVVGVTNARHTSKDGPCETFTAWDRATGLLIEVDDRTFSDSLHSLSPIPAPAGGA